jgi:hypothetical protein
MAGDAGGDAAGSGAEVSGGLGFAWEGGTTVREGSGDCSGAGPCECGGGLWHGGGDGRPLAGHGMSFTGGASHGLAVIKVARGDVIWSI